MYINEYPFDPDLKYLIYFRGNFGPPTRGHFSLVEKFIELENVSYFIHQIGERHGVPYKVNRKVFKIYLEKYSDKIILKKMASSLEVLKYIEDVDVVIYLKGAEDAEPLTKHDGKNITKRMIKRYKPLIHKLKKRGIPLDFLYIDRPQKEKLSATKFTEAISENSNNLRYFVPKHLTDSEFKYVISKLRKYIKKD